MRPPNILFIMSDDHTSQAWGCYGSRLAPYIRTPSIDRLAKEGARLTNCFCTNSICTPSRATILTGQYSHVNGVRTLADALDPNSDTLAKRLKAGSYETGIVGKWHLGTEPQGFDYFDVLHGQGDYHDPVLWRIGDDWSGNGRKHAGHSTDVITDIALGWLRGRTERDKPYFLMCHYKAPHEPFYSHDRYRSLYDDVEFPEPPDLLAESAPIGKVFEGWPLEKTFMRRCLDKPDAYSPPRLVVEGEDAAGARKLTYQKLLHDYMRTVAGIDDNLARLLDFVDDSGQAEDTVVIYTSDQGYFLGEHNLFDKRFMLEESLRMPFAIRYPREITAGSVVEEIITNVDFAQTLLDIAGVGAPKTMQGRSFRGALCGDTPCDWPDSMYYHYWTAHETVRPSHYGIRSREHKLIFYYGLVRDEGRRADDCWEFYDLVRDPFELANRYDDPAYAAIIHRLKERLAALRAQCGDVADPAIFYP